MRKSAENKPNLAGYMHYSGNAQFEVLKNLLNTIYQTEALFKEAEMTSHTYEGIFDSYQQEQEQLFDTIEKIVLKAREDSSNQLEKIKEQWADEVASREMSDCFSGNETEPLDDL